MPPGVGYGRSPLELIRELRAKKNPREGLSRRFMTQAGRDEAAGTQLEDEAAERLRGFDAEEGARRAGRAQFEDLREDLERDVGDLRGSQVGRGRINQGFGFDEEDELVGEAYEDLQRQLAANAMQAQGLNLSATGQLAGLGTHRTGRFLDILGSERDASFLEEEMERRRKAASRSGLFGALGTIAKGAAGFAAGGPAGAALALGT